MPTQMTTEPNPRIDLPREVPVPDVDKNKPCWQLSDLTRGGKEALIVHDDALYRLKVTRQGKLILCK